MNNPVYAAAIWIIPLVIAIVLHEISHGWVANALGDPTAKRLGRLSVNPITHIDPVGTLLVPLGLAIAHLPVFGWAKPVPVDSTQLRNPRRDMMIVALAGPAMNLVLALVGALGLAALHPLWRDAAPTGVALFVLGNLVNFIQINVFLAVFNLLPIPPFDGGHVVEGLLPRPLALHYGQIARYAFAVMLFLLVILPMIVPAANVVERVVGPPVDLLTRFFFRLAGLRA
ncbi:site-2 protease family protein [Sphingomonas oligophenolica]|uniref:site-2 protease family protein n=1 Tax=Sphingomonas oligophenolica TaxID=301154 RepID=UPI0031D0F248